jgi:hypothetical protein
MILITRQENPKLEFELGQTEKLASNGEIIRVSLTSAYPSNYILNLETDLEVNKITDFVWDVIVTDEEKHTIRLFLTTIDKSIERHSNTLTING